jgi:dTDP-4-amino-4,6-dideoxygalactose transaminase
MSTVASELPFVSIAKPQMGEAEKTAVLAVLESGMLAQGRVVAEFESRFARLCQVKEAVAVGSGTAALWLSLIAHGIGAGDEVITTPFSFIASSNCILYVGATPVFVDIEADTSLIDVNAIEAKITERTRAILPVHLYGQPCDMAPLVELANRYSLIVIEDACQAHGATYQAQPVGSFGTGAFSFYPTKNMTTAEGGIITTNDEAMAERMRVLRNHGQTERYRHEVLGYHFRSTDLQAAIGLAQLNRLNRWNQQRVANAAYLSEGLRDLRQHGLATPVVRRDREHVFHQYTLRVPDRREALQKHLRQRGIGTAIHYPLPIHRQPLYQSLGFEDALPNAEAAGRQVLSLPVHPALSPSELSRIVEGVVSFYAADA